MKIEDIKKRYNNFDFVHSFTDDNGCDDEWKDAHEPIGYLLAIIEQAEKALQYYADLNKHAYHDAIQGELYSDWWLRQSDVAVEALKAIREG